MTPSPTIQPATVAFDPIVLRGDLHENLTDEQFFAFCQDNPTLRIERLPDHTITIVPPCLPDASFQSGEVFGQLRDWNKRTRAGKPYESSAGFTLPDTAIRSPDVAWISNDLRARLTPEQLKSFWQVAPDFIAEVQSSSDSLPALHEKMRAWIGNGVRLAFLISPTTETAWVYRADGTVTETQGFDAQLSGEDVLPGFTLELAELRG